MGQPAWIIIGNPESRPVALFQAALARCGLPPARIVAYADLLAHNITLCDVVQDGDIVRIETPGRNFAVEIALLQRGVDAIDPETLAYAHASAHWLNQVLAQHAHDRGAVWYPRQWYLGYCALLQEIAQQLAACPPHRRMNQPNDIEHMFDKRQCHARLAQAGMLVPRSPGPIQGYADLLAAMQQMGWHQVFVKLAHGSSASGSVAYRTNGQQHRAVTTVDTISYDPAGYPILFNTRRLRTLHDRAEIATLIDAVCQHRAHVEQWLPKAGIDGATFDLRVVMIAGQVCHVVPRLSNTPMTNLHLLNRRGNIDRVRQRMGETAWQALCQHCQQVMTLFPGSLYAGLDVLLLPGYHQHVILECNAFGDLLPGMLWHGMDTYEAEIVAMLKSHGEPLHEPGRGHTYRQQW
ncbi:MAG: hypothetical protein HC837_14240 [Chloroflexaceae bacterium]|nr:hypothetical protein [Chloroflexaceae bacterium]